MNRETRDKFASGTQRDLTSGNACWETPPAVFAKLNADFGPFDIDLTADAQRTLCPLWFGPGSPLCSDALSAEWRYYGGSKGYSNPPYGPFVAKMLVKAKEEQALGFETTLLLPLRITKAFKDHVMQGASELLFCDKRIAFWENGAPRINSKTGKPDAAMFDSIIVRYTQTWRTTPVVGVWHVPCS